MAEIPTATNYLEACQAWQEVINAQQSIEDKNAAGDEALRHLSGQTFQGTRQVVVDGETALYLPDGTSPEEQVWPFMQFERIISRGWLGRLNYVRMREEAVITWALYDPSVVGPVQEEQIDPGDTDSAEPLYQLPIDQPTRRALHFPVGLINYAICYDK